MHAFEIRRLGPIDLLVTILPRQKSRSLEQLIPTELTTIATVKNERNSFHEFRCVAFFGTVVRDIFENVVVIQLIICFLFSNEKIGIYAHQIHLIFLVGLCH